MKYLLLTVGLLTASAAVARADTWTTTEPDGTQARTIVRAPNEPARDYSSTNSAQKFFPSQTETITRGAQIPNNVNQLRPNTVYSSQLQVGTWVPAYPYYGYPYQNYQPYCPPAYNPPAYYPPAYYPPAYTPLTPHAGVVTSGGYVGGGYGYPYGYVPANPGYYPYPYAQTPQVQNPWSPGPYAQNPWAQSQTQVPTWNFYGYNGPAYGGNSGYYSRSTNSTGGRVTIGGGGIRGSIGSSRTTTTGSYSTFP